jgi:hypothetical protein
LVKTYQTLLRLRRGIIQNTLQRDCMNDHP